MKKPGQSDLRSFVIDLIPIILISCLGIIVYSNTFYCSFHFDDGPSIIDNLAIRNIHDLQSIWNFLPRRFILYLSLAFNYHFNGLDVFGYHIFNLAVHLVSAILVWRLTLLTLSTPAMKENKITQHAKLIALFAGLVFVSHPVQTEAVTYIVQRAASMATLFYVASLCLYVKSRLLSLVIPAKAGIYNRINSDYGSPIKTFGDDKKQKIYYISSLILAVMAMFTKEIAITLPLTILLYEFIFLKTKKNFNWVRFSPFLLTIFIIPLTIMLTESLKAQQMRGVVAEGPSGISSIHYLLTQFRVMVTYIRLVFLPLNQNVDYDYPIFKSIFELPVLVSFLFLVTILSFAKYLFLKCRLVSFSFFLFFLTLLPESSFLPIRDVIFEHRLYLPLVGYSMFLVSGVYYGIDLFYRSSSRTLVVTRHSDPRSFASLRMTIAVLLMIITFNSILTYQRNKVWKNEFILWEDIVRKSSHKARPYLNRCKAYDSQGNLNQALLDCNKAIEIAPEYADAYYVRGSIYNNQGNVTQAISDFTKAIEMNPKYLEAYNNRGNAFDKQGSFIQAISDYNKAIEINPHSAIPYNDRGVDYYRQGNLVQAISDYNKAIEINPEFADAYNNRANASFTQGNLAQAMSDYNKAIEINPKYVDAYCNRAILYYQLKRYDDAWADVHKVEGLGYAVNPPQLLEDLKKVSGVE